MSKWEVNVGTHAQWANSIWSIQLRGANKPRLLRERDKPGKRKPSDDTNDDSESETFLDSGVRIADDSQRKGFVNGRGNNNLNIRD